MALTRAHWLTLAGAAVIAVVTPLWLLQPGASPQSEDTPPLRQPLAPPPLAPLSASFERPLFGASGEAEPTAPADAPALVGIVGRLNQDAVALVRTADGSTRSLKPGESVDGWRLASLAIDAAFFTRGNEKARVALGGDQTSAQ